MPGTETRIHVTSIPGLVGYFVLWIVLVESARMLVTVLRNEPLIGWAVGPLGVSTLALSEPSLVFMVFNTFLPAIVSGLVLYIGFFTALPSPIVLPHTPLVETLVIVGGVLLTSTGDLLDALRDLRYPLWGEARILRSIQFLHASWATIHFTSFGLSYLREHFGSSPAELLQTF